MGVPVADVVESRDAGQRSSSGLNLALNRVTNQHKQRLAADESYLAASLKVPPPKKKTLRSEGASEAAGWRDAEAETKACLRVRFRLFLAFFEIENAFLFLCHKAPPSA